MTRRTREPTNQVGVALMWWSYHYAIILPQHFPYTTTHANLIKDWYGSEHAQCIICDRLKVVIEIFNPILIHANTRHTYSIYASLHS